MTAYIEVWLALIAVIPVTVAAFTTAILVYRSHQGDIADRVAAQELKRVTDHTYLLSNHTLGTTMEALAVMARRVADGSGDEGDLVYAEQCEARYKTHMKQQALVDQSKLEDDAKRRD